MWLQSSCCGDLAAATVVGCTSSQCSPGYALCFSGASEPLADHRSLETDSGLVGHLLSSMCRGGSLWLFVVRSIGGLLDASANTCRSLNLFLHTLLAMTQVPKRPRLCGWVAGMPGSIVAKPGCSSMQLWLGMLSGVATNKGHLRQARIKLLPDSGYRVTSA